MNSVSVKTAAWYGDRDVDLTFPEDWPLKTVEFESRPVLTDAQVREVFMNPVGTPRISEMAAGRKSACILADDLTRPTPASRVIPFIIEELIEAGIDEDSILIFMAHGCHRQMRGPDINKKIGIEVARNFAVRQNEMDDPFVNVGTTSYGVPIEVNQWVVDCEFKIGVGGPYPHGSATFSGGGKIILPGCCSHLTNSTAHQNVGPLGKQPVRAGKEISPFRLNSEEAARLAGLDATCLTILNNAREVTGLVVGDVVKAHRAAVKIARKAYAIHMVDDAEVVVATGYPRDHDIKYSSQGLWPLTSSNGSAKVLVASGSEGVGYHRMGIINAKNKRAEENREREELSIPTKADIPEFLFLSSDVGPAEVRDCFPNAELVEAWDTARGMLEDRFRGKTPKVAVYPSSAIAYPATG
jgi:nickel-dependent lactate racemase